MAYQNSNNPLSFYTLWSSLIVILFNLLTVDAEHQLFHNNQITWVKQKRISMHHHPLFLLAQNNKILWSFWCSHHKFHKPLKWSLLDKWLESYTSLIFGYRDELYGALPAFWAMFPFMCLLLCVLPRSQSICFKFFLESSDISKTLEKWVFFG